ncbi:heatR3 [Acrasis kona]|uniref:HeatR3 n=1 Tax=Acrasis kona TaxID=1008807 RepID=A0AAW2YS20_9EUKA
MSVEDAAKLEKLEGAPKKVVVPPVVKDLDSANDKTREQACLSLAHLVTEENGINLPVLIQAGAIRKLIQKLCDPVAPIRLAAAGALKNITIVGGEGVCEDMVSNDVMTTLLAALNQSLTRASAHDEEQQQQELMNEDNQIGIEEDIAEQDENLPEQEIVIPAKSHKLTEHKQAVFTLNEIIHLLSFLCENSDKATRIITERKHHDVTESNTNTALGCLMTVLSDVQMRKFTKLILNTAQCLNVISDNNAPLMSQISHNHAAVELLLSLLNSSDHDLLFRTCIAGVLYNIHANVDIQNADDSSKNQSTNKTSLEIFNRIVGAITPVLLQATRYNSASSFIEEDLVSYKLSQRVKKQQDLAQAESQELIDQDSDDEDELENLVEGANESDGEVRIRMRYNEWYDRSKAHNMAQEILVNIVSTMDLIRDQDVYEDVEDEDFEDDNVEIEVIHQDSNSVDQGDEAIQFVAAFDLYRIILESSVNVSTLLFSNVDINNPLLTKERTIMVDGVSRAFNALSNMLLAAESSSTGINQITHGDWVKTWDFVCALMYQPITLSQDVLESLTQILWTLLRYTFNKNIVDARFSLTEGSGVKLAEYCGAVCSNLNNSELLRINSVGLLSELGKRQHDVAKSVTLASLLLNRIETDPSLAVCSEALDALFDVYADEKYDLAVTETRMIDRLTQSSRGIQDRLKKLQKNELERDVVEKVKEARLNLNRFVKYKKDTIKA